MNTTVPLAVDPVSGQPALKSARVALSPYEPAWHGFLLARRDLPALRKVCGVDTEDLSEMIAELKGLTPRPGAGFGGEPAQTVVR